MKTKHKKPTTQQWKKLYELAAELKELAPWEWMEESEIFGVENPETKETGFVSVMGMLGEHLAVGVYLGAEGIHGYFDLHFQIIEENPLALFDVPQLQLSFENREDAEKEDRAIMKKLGLKFRGRQNYPLFRSIRPGFMPWFITADEAEMLIYAIEQTLEVAPRVEENQDILSDENDEDETFLVRFAEEENGKYVWREEMRTIPEPEDEEILIDLPADSLARLESLSPAKGFHLEIDLFPAPTPVGEKGKRPYFPKTLMLADARRGLILSFELIRPEETPAETEVQILIHVVDLLSKLPALPEEIHARSDFLLDFLETFSQKINFKVKQKRELQAIERARDEMFGFFGGGMF